MYSNMRRHIRHWTDKLQAQKLPCFALSDSSIHANNEKNNNNNSSSSSISNNNNNNNNITHMRSCRDSTMNKKPVTVHIVTDRAKTHHQNPFGHYHTVGDDGVGYSHASPSASSDKLICRWDACPIARHQTPQMPKRPSRGSDDEEYVIIKENDLVPLPEPSLPELVLWSRSTVPSRRKHSAPRYYSLARDTTQRKQMFSQSA